ncbi:MAG: hypothetical protein SPJ45_05350 [Anaerovoracaceae bacterium]|nr:hypothetical protein [Bacillota bacterium]MDY5906283.1 hypothetical protein [Anaerovoracaceae bacterium]
MRRVVVDMQNMLFADAVAQTLRQFDPGFQVYVSDSPDRTEDICMNAMANILITEVTLYTPWRIEERLRLRKNLKEKLPGCKVVFVVDENSESGLADRVRQTMKDGLIDNFVYGSVSSTYLGAVIDTL